VCLGIPHDWPVGRENNYEWPYNPYKYYEDTRQCLHCLFDFKWRRDHPGAQRRTRIFTDGRSTMVAQRLGDFARPETPEKEWFEEDDEGRLRINLLRAPTIPAVVAVQTDGWVPDPPPQTRSIGTQMTPGGTEDKAIQAFPTYGTTKYWLDQRDSNPGGPQQRDRDMEPRARLALHPHGLDRLGLDSGGLQRFDFPNDTTPRRELKFCHFHDRMMTHNSDSCPFPHFSCMPGLGVCRVPEDHVWHGGGCLLDGTIEEIRKKRKQMEMLDICVTGPSQSRRKTD
jgi:hypothetical protein